MGMFPAALRRHVGHGAFDQFQQGLLHAFPRHVAGNGGAVGLPRDLVDLININDAALGTFDFIVRGLQQFQNNVLDVFSDVPGFGQGGGIGEGKRHVQVIGQGLSQEGFPCSRRPDHQNIALLELDVSAFIRGDAFIVIVNGDRENFFCAGLVDDVLIQVAVDLDGFAKFRGKGFFGLLPFLGHDFVAEAHAFVADVHGRSRNQFAHLIAAFPAERTP